MNYPNKNLQRVEQHCDACGPNFALYFFFDNSSIVLTTSEPIEDMSIFDTFIGHDATNLLEMDPGLVINFTGNKSISWDTGNIKQLTSCEEAWANYHRDKPSCLTNLDVPVFCTVE